MKVDLNSAVEYFLENPTKPFFGEMFAEWRIMDSVGRGIGGASLSLRNLGNKKKKTSYSYNNCTSLILY